MTEILIAEQNTGRRVDDLGTKGSDPADIGGVEDGALEHSLHRVIDAIDLQGAQLDNAGHHCGRWAGARRAGGRYCDHHEQ